MIILLKLKCVPKLEYYYWIKEIKLAFKIKYQQFLKQNSLIQDFSESKLNQTKFSNKNLFKLNFKIKFRQPLK